MQLGKRVTSISFFLSSLYEVSETLSNIYLMMEYASGGELFARLSDQGPYEEPEARPIFAQIASAIDYMVRAIQVSMTSIIMTQLLF